MLEQAAQRSCNALFLEVFKSRLAGALSYLVWWKVPLPMAKPKKVPNQESLELDGH